VASFSGGRVPEFVSAVVERAISSPRESCDLVAAVEESLYEATEAGRPSARGRTASSWKGLVREPRSRRRCRGELVRGHRSGEAERAREDRELVEGLGQRRR
jgi:hypothetical protein